MHVLSTTLRPQFPCTLPSLVLSFCLTLATASPAQISKPIYATPTQSSISTGALTADFNGDGLPDTVSLTSSSGSLGLNLQITVLLNQGPGNPALPVSSAPFQCSTDGIISPPLAADLNNDKHLDLILACDTGYVAVLLGIGDGSFKPPAFYALSNIQTIATPTDLNGDGFLDVVATTSSSSGPSTVTVLLNQGTASPGTLLNPKPYTANPTGSIHGLGTGDFNGDGKQDFIVETATSPLAVLYGNGDGTLQPLQTTATGGIFATGDFNHGGLTDVACLILDPQNIQPPALQVFLGNSSGKFTTGSSLTLQPQSNYSALVPACTTNAGKNINLAVVADTTTILLGDGNGAFTLGHSYAISGIIVGPQTDANGITNLIYSVSNSFITVTGNGDGTFNAPLAYFLGATGFTAADINGDGLTDILSIDSNGILDTALSRGDGTFSLSGKAAAIKGEFLIPGDFNRDGKTDVIAILPGNGDVHGATLQNSEIFFYKGNGDGTFQPASAPVDLHVVGATQAVLGDFNGDSIPDLVLAYNNPDFEASLAGAGLIFLFGKGDGTFAAPVTLPQTLLLGDSQLVTLDLNNDGKPDIIWNDTIFYANGDGTFNQQPLPATGIPSALGDLNGDGIPDFVFGPSVYAGNGDGTTHASPLYTAALPANSTVSAAFIADFNADGHPDLLLEYRSSSNGLYYLSVSFGDGKGNFVLDNNAYQIGSPLTDGSPTFNGLTSYASLARLNDHAPLPQANTAADFLASFVSASGNVSAVSLLNQLNPAPATLPAPPAPTLFPTVTNLTVSSVTANENQQLTLTASITGINPSGTVTFISGTTTLGHATLFNGTATLTTSFPTPGTNTITASYPGDANNTPSNSNSVSVTIIAPDFAPSASPSSATIKAGQTATFTITATPSGGYAGIVRLSCGPLPAETACNFSSTAITPANGPPTTATLTLVTTAPAISTAQDRRTTLPILASIALLCFLTGTRRTHQRLLRSSLLTLIFAAIFIGLSGCNSSSPPPQPKDPGTPTGLQSISVILADSTGTTAHTLSIQVTIQ